MNNEIMYYIWGKSVQLNWAENRLQDVAQIEKDRPEIEQTDRQETKLY